MYDIIFNALTADALKRFLLVSGNKDIKKSQHKNELIEAIQAAMHDDKDFQQEFISFYRKIEKAGRKDFWFAELRAKQTQAELNDMRNKINKIPKEDKAIYLPPNEGDTKYFNVSPNNNIIEIKVARKKIIREQDSSQTTSDADYDYVVYKKTPIRHVSYIRFDINKGKFLMGVDVWRTFRTTEKLEQLERDIDHIFGAGFWGTLKFTDIKKSAGELLSKYDYIITKELKQQVTDHTNQGAAFSIDTGRIATIRKELNDGKIQLNKIKDKYIEDDVRDNEAYKAAAGKNIDMTTKAGSAVLFYASDVTNLFEYIKFDVFATESRIKFANDNTTLEELEHVFSKIN